MNKIYSTKTGLILFLIIFLNICQIALAQTAAVSTDVSRAIVSADVSKSADAAADVSATASKPGNTPITIPLTTVVPKLDPTKEYERKIRIRKVELFGKISGREEINVKWPLDHLKDNPFPEESKDIEEKRINFDKYCRMFALQYESEAEKLLAMAKGMMSLDRTCDVVRNALKKSFNDIKDINDMHITFEAAADWMLEGFDRAYIRYYYATHARNKVYNKSIFGIVGIPLNYSDIVMQILILLTLGLNFFLLYKVLRER